MTNFYGIPGLAERALTMRTLGDAIALRNRLIRNLEKADFEMLDRPPSQPPHDSRGGGRLRRVETIAGVNDFLREAIEFYPNLFQDSLRVVLVDPLGEILPELGGRLGPYARRKLSQRGIEVRLMTGVQRVTETGVELTDGCVVPADLVIWTAGNAPNPLVATLPCRKEKGRLAVDEEMRVPEWPGVWALGDCASVPTRKPANLIPRRPSMPCGRESFSPGTSSRQSAERARGRSASRQSVS